MNLYHTIKSKFNTNHGTGKVLENFIWLFLDKVIQASVGLFITAWLARYLGQENFGMWSYALAFITLSSAFSTLGIDTIFIRDIVKRSEHKNQIVGSAFLIKAISSVIAYIVCLSIICIIRPNSDLTRLLIFIMAFSFLFQAFDVIDFYFKSQLQSRYVVYARNVSFFIISLSQIILIMNHAPLVAFAWTFLFQSMFSAILLIVFYKGHGGVFSQWRFDKASTIQLLKGGWPLFIAFISSMLYMKIDQIMIGQLLNESAVGIFSAALKIYEIPFSVLVLLTSAFFPKIVEVYEKDKDLFLKRYGQITRIYTASSILLLIFFIAFGKQIIHLIFGSNYAESYAPLVILSTGLIFIYNGMLRSSYLSITHNEKIIFYTSITSALLNVCLNFVLIKQFGIVGSAMATLITQFVSLFLSNYFFTETRKIFFIQLEAFYRWPKTKFQSQK